MKNKLLFLLILVLFGIIFEISSCANDIDIVPNVNITTNQSNQQTVNKIAKCGIENCHGLDIVCGENIPDFCTQEYKLGDKCRQYAKCEITNNECKFIENKEFTDCKACALECNNDFECENKC